MHGNAPERRRRYEIVGWSLFVLSAVGFIIASVQSGNLAAITGSILFFAACLVFLVPILRRD
jgi:hypothetical protein